MNDGPSAHEVCDTPQTNLPVLFETSNETVRGCLDTLSSSGITVSVSVLNIINLFDSDLILTCQCLALHMSIQTSAVRACELRHPLARTWAHKDRPRNHKDEQRIRDGKELSGQCSAVQAG